MENAEFGRVKDILQKYGEDVVAEMIAILDSKGSINLQKSMEVEVLEDMKFIQLTISMNHYAPFTDTGRGPGVMPPKAAIEKWAAERGIPERAVYPIRKKIAEQGTKHAAKDFLKVFYEKFPEIKENIKQEVIVDYTNYFHREINKILS